MNDTSHQRGTLLFVVPDARFFVTHRLPLALAAKARGYRVHVATAAGKDSARIVEAGLEWHPVRFGALRKRPWSDLLTLIDLNLLYRRIKPDIVHHVTFKAVLYGTIAARLHGIRAVVNAMTGLGEVFAADTLSDRFWRALTIFLLRTFVRSRHMRLLVQNADDLRVLVETGAANADQTVLIRGSGVDPDSFIPFSPRADAVRIVSCASRIIETKGIGDFVAAAGRLRAEGLRVRFLLAGDRDTDSGKSIPAATFDAWLRAGDIEYLGMRDDVREVYAQTDVVCLPSWGGEGVPKALIEAAACALPIVTTDVPGCRDIVRQNENGILVPPRDVDSLVAALRTLIENPELCGKMGTRGREIVIAEFSLPIVIKATLAVYETLERETG
jgi:glycosyltransferase involved in cell wall biosynthesis